MMKTEKEIVETYGRIGKGVRESMSNKILVDILKEIEENTKDGKLTKGMQIVNEYECSTSTLNKVKKGVEEKYPRLTMINAMRTKKDGKRMTVSVVKNRKKGE